MLRLSGKASFVSLASCGLLLSTDVLLGGGGGGGPRRGQRRSSKAEGEVAATSEVVGLGSDVGSANDDSQGDVCKTKKQVYFMLQ